MSPLNSPSQPHIAALPLPLWGHTKPLCALLVRLVLLRRVNATFFTTYDLLDKVMDEIARQLLPNSEDGLMKLIRVVVLPCSPLLFKYSLYYTLFTDVYKSIFEGRPIVVAHGKQLTHEVIAPPQLLLCDYYCYEALQAVRSISGTEMPVFAVIYTGLSATMMLLGPESMGGTGDLAARIELIDAKDDEDRDRQVEEMYRRFNYNGLSQVPGLPAMHYYEHMPQASARPENAAAIAYFAQYSNRFLTECDGIISLTSRFYEPGALKMIQEWLGPSKPILAIGSPNYPAKSQEVDGTEKSGILAEVTEFMNIAFKKHGKESVFYISFGTIFWTTEPEKIWVFFDVLIEQNTPFLFSHPSPIASIPEDIQVKVKSSGLGYIAPWLPQEQILSHSACGWYVSHCGHNSIMDSLSAGIPIICWPFDVDQPVGAVLISLVHKAGYELLSVRTGRGLLPLHRLNDTAPDGSLNGVRREVMEILDKARGEDGKERREKAKWFKRKFKESWSEGGDSWIELEKVFRILK